VIYLLDTNILIYLIKNRPPQVAERIDQLPSSDRLAMSFVTWAELLQGAAGSTRRAGTPIGANDLWIACHALALGATLVTHNLREFSRIRGLSLVDWAEEP
jgi:tRNA(fMet)-specific endonuclease VapC